MATRLSRQNEHRLGSDRSPMTRPRFSILVFLVGGLLAFNVAPTGSETIPELKANNINDSTVVVGSNNTIAVSLTNAPRSGRIDVDVSVPKNDDPEVMRVFGGFDSRDFNYIARKKHGILTIRLPDEEYVTQYQSGSVEALDYGYFEAPIWPANFPILDVRLLNNSANTIVVKEIELDIAESRPDNDPLIVLVSAATECGRVVLVNQGWSAVKNCTFEFNLYPADKAPNNPAKVSQPYKYHVESGSFTDVTRLDFRSSLQAEGVDVDYLRNAVKHEWNVTHDLTKFRKALGRFKTGIDVFDGGKIVSIDRPEKIGDDILTATAEGQFKVFTDASPEQPIKTVLFKAVVPLTMPGGLGGALPALGGFDVRLKATGKDYPVRIPVSAQLNPGTAERFLIRTAARQSSWHRFNVRALLMSDQIVEGPSVDMYLFLPHNSVPSAKEIADAHDRQLSKLYQRLQKPDPK
jgi:hypothetical protein